MFNRLNHWQRIKYMLFICGQTFLTKLREREIQAIMSVSRWVTATVDFCFPSSLQLFFLTLVVRMMCASVSTRWRNVPTMRKEVTAKTKAKRDMSMKSIGSLLLQSSQFTDKWLGSGYSWVEIYFNRNICILPSWESWGECIQYRPRKERWSPPLSSFSNPFSSRSLPLRLASTASETLQSSSSRSSPPLVKTVEPGFGRCQKSTRWFSRPSQNHLPASWSFCLDSLLLSFPNWGLFVFVKLGSRLPDVIHVEETIQRQNHEHKGESKWVARSEKEVWNLSEMVICLDFNH